MLPDDYEGWCVVEYFDDERWQRYESGSTLMGMTWKSQPGGGAGTVVWCRHSIEPYIRLDIPMMGQRFRFVVRQGMALDEWYLTEGPPSFIPRLCT